MAAMVSAAGTVQFIVFCLALTGDIGSTREKIARLHFSSQHAACFRNSSQCVCSVFDLQGAPLSTTAEESLCARTNPSLLGSSVGTAGDSTSFFGMPQLNNL